MVVLPTAGAWVVLVAAVLVALLSFASWSARW
jgi:hypothetical protein